MNKGEIMKRPKETLTSREIIEKLTVPDGEAVRRVRVRKEAAHAEYP